MMEEVKKPRNTLDIQVNVDTDEAQEKLERLKKATEGCTKAFEELGKAIAHVGALFNSNQAEQVPFDIDLTLSEKKQLKDWIGGRGPLEK